MTRPRLSVVVCTYNRGGILRESLDTVLAQETGDGFDAELVVIDDGSTDDTAAVVQAAAEGAPFPVRYVYEGSRAGIAVARNRGIAEARGDCIVFFDDDQLADRRWLGGLAAVMRAQGAAIVGGARRLDLPQAKIDALGPVCRSILGESLYAPQPHVMRGKELPTTGNLLVVRAVFDKVGHFEPGRVTGGEDSEFLGRARAAGFAIWAAPDAMVAHMVPPHRLAAPYFRWVSMRWGHQFATADAARLGRGHMLARAAARTVQAAIVSTPLWWWSLLRGRRAAALDGKLLLWRAQGYVRTAFHLAAPRLFPQRNLMWYLEFRGERALFGESETRGR